MVMFVTKVLRDPRRGFDIAKYPEMKLALESSSSQLTEVIFKELVVLVLQFFD